jgi:hypothetical protein
MTRITSHFNHFAARGILLAAVLLLVGPSAARATVLDLAPSIGSFTCGGTWTIDVGIDVGTTDLRGFSLVLEYDDQVIQPLSVQVGNLVSGAACPNFLNWIVVGNTIEANAANLGCSIAGPGTILTVVFEGVISGTSAINVRNGTLRTGTNDPIAFSSNPASVYYDCAVATDALGWGALKATYR